jgi:hypothetical protein
MEVCVSEAIEMRRGRDGTWVLRRKTRTIREIYPFWLHAIFSMALVFGLALRDIMHGH